MFVFLLRSFLGRLVIIMELLPCRGSFISNDLTYNISNVKMVRLHDQYYYLHIIASLVTTNSDTIVSSYI